MANMMNVKKVRVCVSSCLSACVLVVFLAFPLCFFLACFFLSLCWVPVSSLCVFHFVFLCICVSGNELADGGVSFPFPSLHE